MPRARVVRAVLAAVLLARSPHALRHSSPTAMLAPPPARGPAGASMSPPSSRPPLAAGAFYESADDDADDGETYEAAWRRRRKASLREAEEISFDEVNDLFEPDYLTKRLHERNPESAFGAVFRLEGTVANVDTLPTFLDAWSAVAKEFDYAAPSERDVAYVASAGLRNEVAIDTVFQWTRDWGAAREAAARYGELLSAPPESEHQHHDNDDDDDDATTNSLNPTPREGVAAWLQDLTEGDVPCGVVSRLPRRLVIECLEALNLTAHFGDRLICAEDGRDRAQQALLHAAVQICVKSTTGLRLSVSRWAPVLRRQSRWPVNTTDSASTPQLRREWVRRRARRTAAFGPRSTRRTLHPPGMGPAACSTNGCVWTEEARSTRHTIPDVAIPPQVEVERQPGRVVVFSDVVDDLIAAHEAEMRAVGIVGTHPAYELQVADLVVRDLDELRLANIRKLFSDVDFDPLPDLELEELLNPKPIDYEDDLEYDDYEGDHDAPGPPDGWAF